VRRPNLALRPWRSRLRPRRGSRLQLPPSPPERRLSPATGRHRSRAPFRPSPGSSSPPCQRHSWRRRCPSRALRRFRSRYRRTCRPLDCTRSKGAKPRPRTSPGPRRARGAAWRSSASCRPSSWSSSPWWS